MEDPIAILSLSIGLFGATYACLRGIYEILNALYKSSVIKADNRITSIITETHGKSIKAKAHISRVFIWIFRVIWWCSFRAPTLIFACFIFLLAFNVIYCEGKEDHTIAEALKANIDWTNCVFYVKIGTYAFLVCIGSTFVSLLLILGIDLRLSSYHKVAQQAAGKKDIQRAVDNEKVLPNSR